MTYFNGGLHGWNDPILGYVAPEPITKIYCDDCAEKAIPLPPYDSGKIGRHWDTGFRWAPFFGGKTKCNVCKTFC